MSEFFKGARSGEKIGFYDKRLYEPSFFLEEVLDLKLAKFHKEWLRFAKRYKNVCFMAARGHGKTEVMIVGFMLYSLYEAILDQHYKVWRSDRSWFEGAIISKSMPQSTAVLRRLKYRMLDSPLLRRFLPSGRDGKIASMEIILKNRHRIVCRPYSDTVRGIHVNLCCIDEAGTFEDERIYTDAIVPIVQKYNGKIVTIGTPTSQVDLLYKLFENPQFFSRKYPAFTDARQTKSLWPLEFNRKKLMDIKQTIGSLAFSREYLCQPVGEEDRIFPFSLIEKSFEEEGRFVHKRRSNDFSYYIGCDFAMSASAEADYSVFIVVEKNKEGKVRLCEIKRTKGEPFEVQLNRLIDMYNRFQPTKVLIDKRHIGHTFLDKMVEKGMRVEGFNTTRKSKEDLIMHVRNQFEKRKIIIPRHTSIRGYGIDILIKELLSYATKLTPQGQITYEGLGEHDDTVIALCLAVYVATKYTYSPISIKRSSYRKG